MKTQILFIALFAVFFLIYAGIRYLKKRGVFKTNSDFSTILTTAFPSSIQELTKFGIVRALFGVFLLQRALFEWYYIMPMDFENLTYVWVLSLTTIFSLTILFGLLTNVSLALMTFLYFGEQQLRAGTLGNDIAAILAIMLIFCLSYKSMSLDRVIENKISNKWEIFSGNFLFNLSPQNTEIQFARAKFIVVLSYWCLCLYSAFKHYASPTWMSGDAALYLMTSAYLNEHYQLFRDVFHYESVREFFRYSMFLMFPWYALFLPAFFIKGFIRAFIVVWWVLFIILSHFFLNLSALGMFEFIMIAALVIPATRRNKEIVTFFYDGKCNLCARTIKFFKAVDFTRKMRFITFQSAKETLDSYDVSQEVASSQLAGLYKDKIYIGYDLYSLLTRALPLLWPLYPVLLLGKVVLIGPRIYSIIALNRIKLFGSCQLPEKRTLAPIRFRSNNFTSLMNIAAFASISMLAVVFLCNPPVGGQRMKDGSKYRDLIYPLYKTADLVGIAAIDVFNYKDLNMSRNWRVINYCDENFENCDIVPLNGYDGERLNYHHADTLYFGGTLKWRRRNLEEVKLCDYGKDAFESTEYINQILSVYMRKNGLEEGYFTMDYYNNPLPDMTNDDWPATWWNPTKNCTFYLRSQIKDQATEVIRKEKYE